MKGNKFSPVVVFAFNRADALRNTIAALAANAEAADTDLYVFVDGPREDREGEAAKVDAVRSFVTTITGFRSVTHVFSEKNKGLGPSIIAGVTDVINRHGTAIVVEDYSKPVKDKRQENYELSDFGNLEKRLCDESYYRLKCLN